MKKIILILCMIIASHNVSAAAEVIPYGTVISGHTFEGYNLYYDYGSSEITDEESHSGKHSRKLDAAQKTSINLHTNAINIEPEKQYYAEVWVKGDDGNILYNKNSIWVMGSGYLNQVFLRPSYTDENGWTKYAAHFKATAEQTSLRLVIYFDAASNPCENTFYFDDIRIYSAPYRLTMDSITADKMVNLNKANIYGLNPAGEKEKIAVGDSFRWSVVLGDARIDKYGNLVYDGIFGETVRIKCEALGLSCEADVKFKGNIGIEFTENTVRISNYKDTAIDASVYTVLYDKENRVYDAGCTDAFIVSGGMEEISVPKVYAPGALPGQTKKVIICADGSMESYAALLSSDNISA